ncbi:MAG: methyl-accepting chemotaxis protein, partial [Fibromonadales bacterium]|nr:methyl-accepting chemotaxis protein [Fibromonadales bacterium]
MKNIKMGIKLIGSFLAVTLVALITGIYLFISMDNIDSQYSQLDETATQPLERMIGQVRLINNMRTMARDLVLAKSVSELNQIDKETNDMVSELRGMIQWQKDKLIFKDNEFVLDSIMRNTENYNAEISNMVKEMIPFVGDASEKILIYEKHLVDLTKYLSVIVEYNDRFTDIKRTNSQKGQTDNSEFAKKAQTNGVIFLIIMFIASVAISIYMTLSITGPLKKVVETLKKGEDGDMRARANIDQKDEIGVVADSVDNFFEKIQGILKNLYVNSDTLAGASEELSSVSRQLASGAEETVGQSNTVASTSEQMAVNINAMASGAEQASVNANEVAGAAEQMSTNMNTIASAIEEMSASINQIAGNTSEVRQVATEATDKANDATDVMSKLGAAAKEIGQVTDVIKRIADKTNLLALNATIEAASAGEAGKGFAV